MGIPPEIMNRFFEPLVGTPERVTELTQYLTVAVTDKDPAQQGIDPYDRLLKAGVYMTRGAALTIPGISSTMVADLQSNAKIGTDLTVNALKTLGGIYKEHATVPQQITGVRQNASEAIRHIYGIAFTDGRAGTITMRANHLGLSPRNPATWAYYLLHGKILNRRADRTIGPRAFRVVSGEAGQLDISFRHRRLSKLEDRRCPATYTKAATPEGPRSALLLFMATIGRVAVDEIYPQYFDITRD